MDEAIDKELTAHGVNINGLTEHQKYLMVEPSYAPENYRHDGEITLAESRQFWIAKMKRAGIPSNIITQVKRIYKW